MQNQNDYNLVKIQNVKERIDTVFFGIYSVKPHVHRDEVIGLDLICKEEHFTKVISEFIPNEFPDFAWKNVKLVDDGQLVAFFYLK